MDKKPVGKNFILEQGSEEIYKSLFTNNNSIMLLIDPENLTIVDANKAAIAFYGWENEEHITKSLREISVLDEDKIREEINNIVLGDQRNFIFRHRLANGSIRDVEVNSSPIVINNNRLIYSIIQDITDHKKAEEALRVSRQKLDLHHVQTPLAVIEWDLSFNVQFWNPAAEKIFGYKEKEILGKHSSLILPDEDKEGVDEVWEHLLTQRGGKHNINRNITKNGELLFCEWFNTPIIDERGKTVAVSSLVRDITSQRQAEKAVQFERDKLNSVINAIGYMLYIINSDYIVEFQNNAAREEFGEITGRKCYEKIFQRNSPCEFCLLKNTLEMNCINHVETSSHDKNHYDIIFSPLKDLGDDMKSVVIFRDITEKRMLQAEAMRASHLASLGELAAGVAHEINNPVTGIISLAEVITDKFEEIGGDKKIPEMIVSEGERIGTIVKNLLSFARKKNDEQVPVPVYHVLKLSLELMERHIQKDGIHLSVDLSEENPFVTAHSQEIQQVFINILSNARYALNKRYPGHNKNKTLNIQGECVEVENNVFVRFTFFDQGIGIPKASIDSITDPFFSTKPHGEGTGLGLSISHGIIANHGGKLWFDSREGEYTKTMVDLPLNEDQSIKEGV